MEAKNDADGIISAFAALDFSYCVGDTLDIELKKLGKDML